MGFDASPQAERDTEKLPATTDAQDPANILQQNMGDLSTERPASTVRPHVSPYPEPSRSVPSVNASRHKWWLIAIGIALVVVVLIAFFVHW